MCSVSVVGSDVVVEWDEPIARIAPMSFSPGETLGDHGGRLISPTGLGDCLCGLILSWRGQHPDGSVQVRTKQTTVFRFSNAETAERERDRLAELVVRHTREPVAA